MSFRASRCVAHSFVGPDHRGGVDRSTHSQCIRSLRTNIATGWYIRVSQAMACYVDVVMDSPTQISKQHRTFYKLCTHHDGFEDPRNPAGDCPGQSILVRVVASWLVECGCDWGLYNIAHLCIQ